MPQIRVDDKESQNLGRLAQRLPQAVTRGMRRFALQLGAQMGRNIETRKKFPPGTRRLSRAFLVPEQQGPMHFVLGAGAPIYANIEEVGGVIRARNAPYLVFQHPPGSGEWHSVKQVTHEGKHYARDAIREESPKLAGVLVAEMLKELT